jgi:hypothetical protein
MDLIENGLLDPGSPVGDEVRKKLLASAPTDVTDLLPHLEQRGTDLAARAQELLTQRGEKEAAEMRAILEDQRKRIAATQTKMRDVQGGLFDQDDMKQLDADRKHWAARLARLDGEIETEPGRIRDLYQVKATRVEPVGLVYLWPRSG